LGHRAATGHDQGIQGQVSVLVDNHAVTNVLKEIDVLICPDRGGGWGK
jgi:hypothetical protein